MWSCISTGRFSFRIKKGNTYVPLRERSGVALPIQGGRQWRLMFQNRCTVNLLDHLYKLDWPWWPYMTESTASAIRGVEFDA